MARHRYAARPKAGRNQRVGASRDIPASGQSRPHGEIVDRLEDPIFLIDEQRNVLYRNAAADLALAASTGLNVRLGRLVVPTHAGDAQLERALAESARSANALNQTCRGLTLSRKRTTRDWLLLISPLCLTQVSPHRYAFIVHLVSRLHPRQLPATALRIGRAEKNTRLGVSKNSKN